MEKLTKILEKTLNTLPEFLKKSENPVWLSDENNFIEKDYLPKINNRTISTIWYNINYNQIIYTDFKTNKLIFLKITKPINYKLMKVFVNQTIGKTSVKNIIKIVFKTEKTIDENNDWIIKICYGISADNNFYKNIMFFSKKHDYFNEKNNYQSIFETTYGKKLIDLFEQNFIVE